MPCRLSLSGTPQRPQRPSSHPLLEAPTFGATAPMEGEGALSFMCVVARGFVVPPARTGSLGSWLSPQHRPQVHVYKQGELISRGYWAGLTCHRGHGARPCLWAGRHRWPLVTRAGLWGAASPGCPRQLSLARMPAWLPWDNGKASSTPPATDRSCHPRTRTVRQARKRERAGQARDLYVSSPSLFVPHPWKLEAPHKVILETQKTYCTAEVEEIKQRRVQLPARPVLFPQN